MLRLAGEPVISTFPASLEISEQGFPICPVRSRYLSKLGGGEKRELEAFYDCRWVFRILVYISLSYLKFL